MWRNYERNKRQIQNQNLTPEQYERAIRDLGNKKRISKRKRNK